MEISIKSWKNEKCKKCIAQPICDYQIVPDGEKCSEFKKRASTGNQSEPLLGKDTAWVFLPGDYIEMSGCCGNCGKHHFMKFKV
jgi:hypothetical protein